MLDTLSSEKIGLPFYHLRGKGITASPGCVHEVCQVAHHRRGRSSPWDIMESPQLLLASPLLRQGRTSRFPEWRRISKTRILLWGWGALLACLQCSEVYSEALPGRGLVSTYLGFLWTRYGQGLRVKEAFPRKRRSCVYLLLFLQRTI